MHAFVHVVDHFLLLHSRLNGSIRKRLFKYCLKRTWACIWPSYIAKTEKLLVVGKRFIITYGYKILLQKALKCLQEICNYSL